MEVFWAKGYQGTTPQDLLKAMGLSKSSFYATFGSKRDLFLRCIKHYNEKGIKSLNNLLSSGNARSTLEVMYQNMVDAAVSPNGRRGCMLTNSATELLPHDAEVEALVNQGLSGREEVFYKTLVRGQKSGDIATKHDARSLARFLLMNNTGFQVMAKTSRSRKALTTAVRVLLSVLD